MKPGKKQSARLKRRLDAFEKTVAKLKNPSGYHKPGSMNRKKAMPAGSNR